MGLVNEERLSKYWIRLLLEVVLAAVMTELVFRHFI